MLRAWPVVDALWVLTAFVPSRVVADSSTGLRTKADHLSQQNADLSARSHSALLELYALDSRLTQERARIVSLRIRTAQVRAERAASERRLASARRSLAAAERRLSLRPSWAPNPCRTPSTPGTRWTAWRPRTSS